VKENGICGHNTKQQIWSSMVFDQKRLFEKLQIVVNTYILGMFTMGY
jgi:hypothetical protein